jgi:hypothetical protein
VAAAWRPASQALLRGWAQAPPPSPQLRQLRLCGGCRVERYCTPPLSRTAGGGRAGGGSWA